METTKLPSIELIESKAIEEEGREITMNLERAGEIWKGKLEGLATQLKKFAVPPAPRV